MRRKAARALSRSSCLQGPIYVRAIVFVGVCVCGRARVHPCMRALVLARMGRVPARTRVCVGSHRAVATRGFASSGRNARIRIERWLGRAKGQDPSHVWYGRRWQAHWHRLPAPARPAPSFPSQSLCQSASVCPRVSPMVPHLPPPLQCSLLTK